MKHSNKNEQVYFDSKIAEYYSVSKAIILLELKQCTKFNINTKTLNYKLPLSYYPARQFAVKFKFLAAGSVKRFLKGLVEDGILFRCIANNGQADVTFSYLVNIEKYNSILKGETYSSYDDDLFQLLCSRCIINNDFNEKKINRFLYDCSMD